MAEGDTIFRLARKVESQLLGQEVMTAHSRRTSLAIGKLVGSKVESIEPRAKHLLMRFSNRMTLHTHMRMNGVWHTYEPDQKWAKPQWQADVILEFAEVTAVCFNAPVVELFDTRYEKLHDVLRKLGPDILDDQLDIEEIRRRRVDSKQDMTIGELLLDQKVVSGIGNIYRCEALFLQGVNPWTAIREITDDDFDQVIQAASGLMKAAIRPGAHRTRQLVYKRNGQPCRKCGTQIQATKLGAQPRTIYWCPNCQTSKE